MSFSFWFDLSRDVTRRRICLQGTDKNLTGVWLCLRGRATVH